MAQLLVTFPEQAAEISSAAQRWIEPEQRPHRRAARHLTAEHRIAEILTSNGLQTAKDYLLHLLQTEAKNPDSVYFIWIHEQLSLIESLLGDQEASRDYLIYAFIYAYYRPDESRYAILSRLLERRAISFYREGRLDEAKTELDAAIIAAFDNPSPWYWQGMVYWGEGSLSSAYAALSMALIRKDSNRFDILYSRGQILAEMHITEQAVADLTEVLEHPQLSTQGALCIRSALCYALLQRAKPQQPRKETASIEDVLSPNVFELAAMCVPSEPIPWPHYFFGLHLLEEAYYTLKDGPPDDPFREAEHRESRNSFVRYFRKEVRDCLKEALKYRDQLNPYRIEFISNILDSLDKDEAQAQKTICDNE